MRAAWRAARDRLVLVSDAVAAAGRPTATTTSARPTSRPRAVSCAAPTGRWLGSALTMNRGRYETCTRWARRWRMRSQAASTVPARIVGRADLGRLAVGAPADIVVLDDRLEVEHALVAAWRWEPSARPGCSGGYCITRRDPV